MVSRGRGTQAGTPREPPKNFTTKLSHTTLGTPKRILRRRACAGTCGPLSPRGSEGSVSPRSAEVDGRRAEPRLERPPSGGRNKSPKSGGYDRHPLGCRRRARPPPLHASPPGDHTGRCYRPCRRHTPLLSPPPPPSGEAAAQEETPEASANRGRGVTLGKRVGERARTGSTEAARSSDGRKGDPGTGA